jgi:hypothetical protein
VLLFYTFHSLLILRCQIEETFTRCTNSLHYYIQRSTSHFVCKPTNSDIILPLCSSCALLIFPSTKLTLPVMGEMEEQSLPRQSTTLDTWYIVCIFGKPVYLFLSALFLLFLHSILSRRVPVRKDCRRNPPDAPNALPVFGHAVAFSSNMARYSLSLK